MDAKHFDINKIDKTIHLLTFGYIREYISNRYKDIAIPKNIILLCACFANVYIDSKILTNYFEINTFIELISNELTDENINEGNLELIYRSTRDGADSKSFWAKCKSKTETVILIQNNNDHKFGCYISIGPCYSGPRNDWQEDKKSFIYGVSPYKNVYKYNTRNKWAIFYGCGENQALWLGNYNGAINISSLVFQIVLQHLMKIDASIFSSIFIHGKMV